MNPEHTHRLSEYREAVEAFYAAHWMQSSPAIKAKAEARYIDCHAEAERAGILAGDIDRAWATGREGAKRLAIQLGYTIF